MMSRTQTLRCGFTLVEALMTLLLISILATLSIRFMGTTIDEAHFSRTLSDMKNIRDAIVGNQDLKDTSGHRMSFGFFGDIGAMPATIDELLDQGAYSAWTTNTTSLTFNGWNGPYLGSGNPDQDYTLDDWGNAYVYMATDAGASLLSKGADGAIGGTGYDADITVGIPDTMRLADVHGFFLVNGTPFNAFNFDVQVWYPDGINGDMTSQTVTVVAGTNGYFTVTGVPMGVRSFQICFPSAGLCLVALGPVLFTLDTQNYVIPASLTDYDPP